MISTYIYVAFLSIVIAAAIGFSKNVNSLIKEKSNDDYFLAQTTQSISSDENKVLFLNRAIEKAHIACPAIMAYPPALAKLKTLVRAMAASQDALRLKIKLSENLLRIKGFQIESKFVSKRELRICPIKAPLVESDTNHSYWNKHSGTVIEKYDQSMSWSFSHEKAGQEWF